MIDTERLRSLVEVEVTEYLWGQPHQVTPLVVSAVFGNGEKLLWLALLTLRPWYFVIRVDSSVDLDSDEFCDLIDDIVDEILDEHARAICDRVHDEHDDDEHSCWESASDIASYGCAWGAYKCVETAPHG